MFSILSLLWIVLAAIAGLAWLLHLGGLSWEQWPPLRWLCIVPIAIAGVLIALRIAIWLHSKKCEECGKWNAMVRFSRKEYKRKAVTLRRTLEEVHRNKDGEVIETVEKEAFVPGVRAYYRVNYKCKFCGHVRTDVEIETES